MASLPWAFTLMLSLCKYTVYVMLPPTRSAHCIKDRTRSLWGPEPKSSAWLHQITLAEQQEKTSETSYHNSSNCAQGKGWQYSLHPKRPDSISHSWENPGSTAVCAQQISAIDHDFRRQSQDVNNLDSQETNVFIPRFEPSSSNCNSLSRLQMLWDLVA